MLTFAQPWGFLGLLGLPGVLAIHFLQRESKRVVVSTLFLLEPLAPESAAGRRWERLRHSVPLWLQLLAVLLLTWLLVQPRWLRRDSVQQVVVVLDSSVSMSAFRPELQQALGNITGRLGRVAATTEWRLAESDPARPAIYSGMDSNRLLQAAAVWEPHLGTHDFLPAINAAQTLLRGAGLLVFVTDRPAELPYGVNLVMIGHPIENCGFGGVTFEGRTWHALVKNYGQKPQTRHWWIESGGHKTAPAELQLAPGQTAFLSGEIPGDTEACELRLDSDAFTWDDRLPLLLPHPKPLAVSAAASAPEFSDFFQRFLASLEHIDAAPAEADLRLVVYDTLNPSLPAAPAIVFSSDPGAGKPLEGEIVTEHDPLTEGLNWSGLLARASLRIPVQPSDRTLVWQGERPLIFLRPAKEGEYLVLNFDLPASNAARLPALVLLLHRFAEGVRAAKVFPERGNFECGQALSITSDPRLPAPVLTGGEPGALRAPQRPGFFDVKQGNFALLHGAARFADVREADFTAAASGDHLREAERRLVERNSRSDFLTPVWLLALGIAMAGSWTWTER